MSSEEITTLLSKPFSFENYNSYKAIYRQITGNHYQGCACSKVDLYNKLKDMIKDK
ncbi:hypothetical protein WSM22_03510 [Cytophagales bacterium WSM2-2]|nr:hypothetical protein WSM22_03510 [Cytophagales bacterium WSM2-2]